MLESREATVSFLSGLASVLFGELSAVLRVKSGRLLVCWLLFVVGLDCPSFPLEASFLFLVVLVGEVEGQAGWPAPWWAAPPTW